MSLLSVVNRISLNGRLIGGFGLLMVLIGSTSIFYNVRIRDVRDNVARIERASAATDTVGDFTRHLLLLRRRSPSIISVPARPRTALERLRLSSRSTSPSTSSPTSRVNAAICCAPASPITTPRSTSWMRKSKSARRRCSR